MLASVKPDAGLPEVRAVFADLREFYAMPAGGEIPTPFVLAAYEPGYLADLWVTVRHTFTDRRLSRRLKEALAFAVSLTSRSAFGTWFHLSEMRRLGVTDRGVMRSRRRDPDVLVAHEDRRHAAARVRHGRHRAGRPHPRARRRAGRPARHWTTRRHPAPARAPAATGALKR